MAADLRYQFTLPASVGQVFEMLTNRDFLAAKVELANSGRFEVSGNSPDIKVWVERTVNADLPAMVVKFVGDKLVVQETQTWQQIANDSYLAKFDLKIPNAPVQINGEISLTGSSETVVQLVGQVKVNVPIFGAAAEPHVIQAITEVLVDEEQLCKSWISK